MATLVENLIEPSLSFFSKHYMSMIVLIYVLYFLTFLGFMVIAPSRIQTLSVVIQICVATYLVLRFHPFRKPVLHKEDVDIIFGSGILLFVNLGITGLVVAFYDKTIHYLKGK
jgi:hypothetical protein